MSGSARRIAAGDPIRDLGPVLRLGAIANLILVAAAAMAWAFSQPMFGTADEAAHFDYAYQVWHGRLPVFEAGLQVPPSYGVRPPVQWTAQHPPLFYLILAPFVGPLVDADQLLAAGYAGRAATALIAVALVAAVMWAASAIAPGRDALWLAVGTVTALYPLVVELGGAIYNDNLFATWTALLVGLSARMVRSGPSSRRLVLFALVAAAAMSTRFAAVPVLGICGAVLLVAFWLRRPRPWRAVIGLAGAAVFAGAASGWFYLRNVALTGNLVGGHFDYLTHRVRRPLLEVVFRREVWEQWLAIHGYELIDRRVATLLLVGLPVVIACAFGVQQLLHRIRRHRQLDASAVVLLGVLLVGLVGVVLLTQLLYVSSGGGASKRYLAPLTVIITFAIAAGLTAFRRLGIAAICVWAALAVVPLGAFMIRSALATPGLGTAPTNPAATVLDLLVAVVALIVSVGVQAVVARRRADDGAAAPVPPPPQRSPAGRGH